MRQQAGALGPSVTVIADRLHYAAVRDGRLALRADARALAGGGLRDRVAIAMKPRSFHFPNLRVKYKCKGECDLLPSRLPSFSQNYEQFLQKM